MKKIFILIITVLLLTTNVQAAEILISSDNSAKIKCTNIADGEVNISVKAVLSEDDKPVVARPITFAMYGSEKGIDSVFTKEIDGENYYSYYVDHILTDKDGTVFLDFNVNIEKEEKYYFFFGGYNVEDISVESVLLPPAEAQQIEPMDKPTQIGGGGSGGGTFTPHLPLASGGEDTAADTAEKRYFSDTDSAHWAYADCIKLYNKGIISGDGDGRLRPDENISREEIATVITKAFNLSTSNADEFVIDELSSEWAKEYIAAVVQNGIMRGYSDNSYRGTASATRAEVVTMIHRAIGDNNEAELSTVEFSDWNEIPEFSAAAFKALIKKSVISGYEDNTLRPNNYISRAELFKIISKII